MSAAPPSSPLHETPTSKISMLAVLRECGFTSATDQQMLVPTHGVRFTHSQLELTASEALGKYFHPIVLLLGIERTERTRGMVEYELPVEVESLEQGMAFLAHAIDGLGTPTFQPVPAIHWLAQGRLHRNQLPWEKQWAAQRAEEASRPRCTVDREWLRLGLRTLAQRVKTLPSSAEVAFHCDGTFLSVCGAGTPLLLPSDTQRTWPHPVRIQVKDLAHLPRRLMSQLVTVTVYPNTLQIDRVQIPRLPDPVPESSDGA